MKAKTKKYFKAFVAVGAAAGVATPVAVILNKEESDVAKGRAAVAAPKGAIVGENIKERGGRGDMSGNKYTLPQIIKGLHQQAGTGAIVGLNTKPLKAGHYVDKNLPPQTEDIPEYWFSDPHHTTSKPIYLAMSSHGNWAGALNSMKVIVTPDASEVDMFSGPPPIRRKRSASAHTRAATLSVPATYGAPTLPNPAREPYQDDLSSFWNNFRDPNFGNKQVFFDTKDAMAKLAESVTGYSEKAVGFAYYVLYIYNTMVKHNNDPNTAAADKFTIKQFETFFKSLVPTGTSMNSFSWLANSDKDLPGKGDESGKTYTQDQIDARDVTGPIPKTIEDAKKAKQLYDKDMALYTQSAPALSYHAPGTPEPTEAEKMAAFKAQMIKVLGYEPFLNTQSIGGDGSGRTYTAEQIYMRDHQFGFNVD